MSWRRSRVAILIDTMFMPVMIIYSIFMQGIPSTFREINTHFRNVFKVWEKTGWFKEKKKDNS